MVRVDCLAQGADALLLRHSHVQGVNYIEFGLAQGRVFGDEVFGLAVTTQVNGFLEQPFLVDQVLNNPVSARPFAISLFQVD